MKRISLLLVLIGFLLLCLVSAPADALSAEKEYAVEDDIEVADVQNQGMVSLDFKDADLKDVLKVFSQQSGLNFVAAKNIEDKKITLYMNNVMVEDALKTLLDANNLGLQQNPGSNILIVKENAAPPLETVTKVYRLKYYHGAVLPGASMFAERKDTSSVVGGGLMSILKPLISEFGNIVEYANLLIITDVPERFKLIDEIIAELDKPITEVLIEVELIETTADFLQELGVKWNKEFMRFNGGSVSTPEPLAIFKDTKASTKIFNYGLVSSTLMQWILEMLQTDSNTKFLAKPRILVQDREWAEIKVTENKIVSVKTVVTDTGDTETEVERMEVGTILRLVPLINTSEGFVSLLLEPQISRPTSSSFTDSNGTNYIDPQLRSMRTVVMAKDGETVAVGGFITTDDEKTTIKVPWLGDIPIVGALFRHTKNDRVDKEMLIFITPKIINPVNRVNVWTQSAIQQLELNNVPGQTKTEEPMPVVTKDAVQESAESAQTIDAPEQVEPAAPVEELPFREQEDLGKEIQSQN